MYIMGGNAKLRAGIFAATGILFIVLAFVLSDFTRTIFLIIGIADLAVAAFTFWMARSAEQKGQTGGGQGWVG